MKPSDPIRLEASVEFEEQLRKLCEQPLNQESLEASAAFFEELYKPDDPADPTVGFRHSYASILMIIYDGKPPANSEEFDQCAQRAEMLRTNLDQLSERLGSRSPHQRVRTCFEKLADHVSLEAQRLTASQAGHNRIAEMQDNFERVLTSQESRIEKMNENHERVISDLDGIRGQHIAILGIFAAVVLVFNGSIGFSASAIEVMGYSPSIGNIVFIVVIVGLALINTVALLLGFIWHMTRSDANLPWPVWIGLVVVDLVFAVLLGLMLFRCPALPASLLL